MKFAGVEIRAEPNFEATCPKCHSKMLELDNGWFSICWYCETCEVPYELTVRKMRKVNEAGLREALAVTRARQNGDKLTREQIKLAVESARGQE